MHDSTRKESFQLSGSYRMLKLTNRFRFHLTHAFARHFEDAPDFLERVGVAVADAVAQLDDLALAVRQGLEHLLDLVLEHLLGSALYRIFRPFVFDEIAEVAVFRLTHRAVQRNRVPRNLQHAARLADRHL